MKKYGSFTLAVICLLCLPVVAKAQTRSEIVVTVPFEFVVDSETLPAGTYTVSRLWDNSFAWLVLSNYENRTSMVVQATDMENASGGPANLRFERVGEQRFLMRIQTANEVYNIPVSRSVILAATAQSVHGGVGSGSSGGN